MRRAGSSKVSRFGAVAMAMTALACEAEREDDRAVTDAGAGDGNAQREGDRARTDAGAGDGSAQRNDCTRIRGAFMSRLQNDAMLLALRACERDEDCTRMSADVDCSSVGTFVGTCGTPVATAQQEAGAQWLRAVTDELCVDAVSGCHSGPKCAALPIACVDQVCSFLARDGGVP